MHYVLIGPTGSGKSVVAAVLSAYTQLPVIASGDIARDLSDNDPSTRQALHQGAMAPEAAMRAAVQTHIENADQTYGGWILDGFPRSIEQLICLSQWSSAMPSYVLLEVEPWVCVERLIARERADDNPDAIARRLESFETKTQPMLSMLDGGGVLHVVHNASAKPTDVIVREIAT